MGGDPRFWNSLRAHLHLHRARPSCCRSSIGLSLALLVMQFPKGQGILRIAAILPIVLAPVVVGLFWRTLVLAPDFGLVDLVTRTLGLGSHNWLGDPQLALISVIAIHTWQWTPFAFLVLLATLATLPPDVYEAARLDRAGAWQRFRYITLPLIRPAIVMVVILRMMTALSAFAAIFAATGGGPGSATEILNLYAYRTSFTELNLGYGASLAVVLLSITLAVSYSDVPAARARHHDRSHRTAARGAGGHCGRGARGLGVSGHLGAAHVVQDRARRARLSAGVAVHADARQLSRGDVRRVVDPAEPLVELRRLDLRDAADDAVRRACRLRAGAAALSGQARIGLLRAGDADAAAGRPHHSLLPRAAEDRRARHLQRPDRHLPHLLAAVRDLADGVVLRGRAASRWRKPHCSTAPDGCARSGT